MLSFSRDKFGNCTNDKYSEVHILKAPSGCIFAHVMGGSTIFHQLNPRWWWAAAKLAHVCEIRTLFLAENAWRHVIRVTPLERSWDGESASLPVSFTARAHPTPSIPSQPGLLDFSRGEGYPSVCRQIVRKTNCTDCFFALISPGQTVRRQIVRTALIRGRQIVRID